MNKLGLWVGVCVICISLGYMGAAHAFHPARLAAQANIPKSYVLASQTQREAASHYFATAAKHHNYEISAATLHGWLQRRPNDVTVIDVRQPTGPAGFASGHIGVADNIPVEVFWHELVTTHSQRKVIRFGGNGSVDQIPIHFFPLPKTKRIVVMCYDGNGGEMIPALLRILGYKAYSLRYGTAMWNSQLNVWPAPHSILALPITTRDQSKINGSKATRVGGDIIRNPQGRATIAAYLNSINRNYPPGYGRPWTIMAGELNRLIHSSRAPVIVDLRSAQAFNRAHIPGSINIPFRALGGELDKLPRNRQIIVVSQAMQSAAQATAVLRILGYRAFLLSQGLVSWNPVFQPPVPQHHYPLVTSH